MYKARHAILILSEILPEPLAGIDAGRYELLWTPSQVRALDILVNRHNDIAAILIHTEKPTCELQNLLIACRSVPSCSRIPIMVAMSDSSAEAELTCLRFGAWDQIILPCSPELYRTHVRSLIHHSSLSLVDHLRHLVDFHPVSDIYNKQHFFAATQQMLHDYPKKQFAFIRFDLEKFRLINSFFGTEEGDRLICYLANHLRDFASQQPLCTYGHIDADIFACCIPFSSRKRIITIANKVLEYLRTYPLTFSIKPVFGIVICSNPVGSINTLLDEATLASKVCKGNYLKNYTFYEESMGEAVIHEQYIVNSMIPALEQEQFVVYLQPKYDLRTNRISGSEALVRWQHPQRGLIPPNKFIPVFERNGFITRLDYYIWEHTCAIIRHWMDAGIPPLPVSVNISRVDVFDPKLVDKICGLVEKYRIPPHMLELELTESAYTTNPDVIKTKMCQLREKGFLLLMDDFGSGYSSLNVLKDIVVDVLKIDMAFLSGCDTPGRGENILDSVVRMAKWLNIPVIAEGVETLEQVNFLRSIGCEFVQGYYFAKPMPAADYEKMVISQSSSQSKLPQSTSVTEEINTDALWSATSQLEMLFSNVMQAMALYEFDGTHIETLRINAAYSQLFGHTAIDDLDRKFTDVVAPEDRVKLMNAIRQVASQHIPAECECRRLLPDNQLIWIDVKLKYIRTVGSKTVILSCLNNISPQKELEQELQKYRSALTEISTQRNCILIIDDVTVNRVIISNIFNDECTLLEASNGLEGLKILKSGQHVDLIMLDLMMPVMDGSTFLQKLHDDPSISNIPVVVMTADSSAAQQDAALELGAKDYIVKPFVPAVVRRRVRNVLNSADRYNDALRKAEKQP